MKEKPLEMQRFSIPPLGGLNMISIARFSILTVRTEYRFKKHRFSPLKSDSHLPNKFLLFA